MLQVPLRAPGSFGIFGLCEMLGISTYTGRSQGAVLVPGLKVRYCPQPIAVDYYV